MRADLRLQIDHPDDSRLRPLSVFAAMLTASSVAAAPAEAASAPSVPEIGAPALAALGPNGVGVIEKTVVDRDAVDPLGSLAQGALVRADRTMPLMIWYPAQVGPKDRRATYRASLVSEPPKPPAYFTVPALAVTGAKPAGSGYPIVLLSHGYNNDPVMLSWLGENLATKGYVVVAIRHRDPAITDTSKTPATLIRRPLDIAFVLRRIRDGLLGPLGDTTRIALAGYSFGGYGVLTVAGAQLDAASPAIKRLPAALADRYTGNGPDAAALHDPAIKAVVSIAPVGGAPWAPWGANGLTGVKAPLLVVAGTADRTVGYDPGPAAIFRDAKGSDRWLLALKGAGHAIGTNPAPAEMRGSVWDFDWFEDRMWRKPRVNSIALHFITAFLDLQLKGDAAKAEYLAVPSEESDGAKWTSDDKAYDAVSEGGANPTWKGFTKDHQNGLVLRHLPPSP
ncbi:MAG: dienelactone hydrolase [Novosphingobium sp.]|nr:dienelactone hydrolase [Novosphingobium sp.]